MQHDLDVTTDRLMRRSGWFDRRTLAWSATRLNIALERAEHAIWRPMRRRNRALPWLVTVTALLAFDILVKVTAMVLDRL